VYLIWSAKASGIESAQDTFIFDDAYKVARQNIAYTMTPCTSLSSVQASWDNHFSAFGAQNLDQIMLDYTNASALHSFEECSCQLTKANGLAEIRAFFAGLFITLSDTSDLTVPVVEVADPKQVYLIWTANASGIESAQDTFIFDDAYKIHRQNIAFTTTNCVKTAPCPSNISTTSSVVST